MISLYPRSTETLVLPFDQKEVIQRIEAVLNKPFVLDGFHKLVEGTIGDGSFRLNIRTRRHEFFMPLVRATTEPTSKGTLVFLSYSLFPGTRALLTFWTLFLPLLAIPLYLESKSTWMVAGLIAFTVMMHVVAWANFRLHLKTARKIVNQLLA